MWMRKRLDIRWRDLAIGAVGCLAPGDRERAEGRLLALWPRGDPLLACTSVRSGLDLLLEAAQLPPGGEVLFSAMTIPDMVRIVTDHGLIPIPVDLDPQTAAPRLEALEAAVSPRTVAMVVAHLFGSRVEMRPLVQFARRRGLMLIEDCAQAYCGPQYVGDSETDASLFSFGPIKSSTALGGAIVRVADAALAGRMRARLEKQPVQSRWFFLRRIAKYGVLKICSARPIFTALVVYWRWRGLDYDRLINAKVRGYASSDFYRRLRQRPSLPLLRLLTRRIRHFDAEAAAQRTRRGRLLARRLTSRRRGALACPSAAVSPHAFWVFPIAVDDPDRLIAALFEHGFDATQGQSMCVVAAPAGSPSPKPEEAQRMLDRLVYLPFNPTIPTSELLRMAEVIRWSTATSQTPVYVEDLAPSVPHPAPH